jgi:hypothetical protein
VGQLECEKTLKMARRKKISGSVQVPGGLGTPPQDAGKMPISQTGGAKSGALSPDSSSMDPDLQRLIDAWPTLPDVICASILAMIAAPHKGR